MSLTYDELQRIENIESTLSDIQERLKGAASGNMLNRLLTLCNQKISEAETNLEEARTEQDRLIALTQKLQ